MKKFKPLTDAQKEYVELKIGYRKFKSKYEALDRILHSKLNTRIQSLETTKNQSLRRLNDATTEQEKETLRTLIKFACKEIEELTIIYELCNELSKCE